MDRFTRLFAALERIFGKGFVSRLMGKQSNVITLPSKDAQRFLTKELNILEASEGAINIGKQDLEKIVSDTKRLSQLNDQELLIITNNAERLAQRVNPNVGPDAEVINLGTKEKVSPEGIMQLKEKMGQQNAPGTLMGDLEGGINKLKASGEDLSKMKGQTLDELMGDFSQGQKTMLKLEDEGLVRATAREIIGRDIKSGKIKLPKELEQDIVQGGGDPVNIWRQFYGEDALEKLDSMVPEFRNMYSPKEAADAAVKKFNFNPQLDRPPGSISIDDAKKAEKEFNIIPADSEEGKIITEKLIGKPKASVTELVTAEKIILDMKKMDPMDAMQEANKVLKKEGKYKNLQEKDVKRIMDDTNDFIFGRDIPEDPEGFAVGGRVGMASGGIAALKTLIRFLGKDSGKKGSKMLKEINPKQFGYKFDMLDPEMKNAINKNRLEYLENLSDVIKADKKLLREMKDLPKEWQDFMYKQANEGGNKGRLDIYNKINIDDAIGDIEQMKKNLEFKDIPGKEIQRKMNAEGGSQGLDYLMGIERRGYQEGTQTTPTEDFSDYLNKDTSSNILKDLYLKDIGITGKDDESRLNILQKYLDFNKNIKNNTALNEYVEGARSGLYSDNVDPYAEGFNLEKDYFKSPNNLRRLAIAYDPRSGKLAYYDKNEGPYGAYKYYSGDLVDQDFVDSFGLKRFDPKDEFGFSGFSTQAYGPTNEQETPTEDLINNLNTTTINTNAQTKPTVAEQMMSPEDALTPEVPQENPIQQHLDFNEFLKGQGLSQQDYNVLGGRDVAQNLAPGNPILGGAINLASPFYNLMQTFDSAKDAQGNVIKQYVPDMYEDGTESGAYYTVPAQKFSDIPGSAARNIQGGLGILTNTQKQQYQDLRNQYETQRQQDQQNYQQRIAQVDPNALNTQYLQKLQNPNATNMDQFKSQLQSNLTPTPMNTGGRVGYAGGGRKKIYDLGKQLLNNKKEKTFGGLQINMSDAMDDARLMKEMGLQGGKPGDYDKFLEMKLSGELGPQKQMQTIKMELFNRYSNFLDDATMDLVQSSNNPQKVAEVYANVKEASILRDRGLGTEEIVDTIVNTPRTKQADGTRPQGLNYLMGY
jgi:hypothetical protein